MRNVFFSLFFRSSDCNLLIQLVFDYLNFFFPSFLNCWISSVSQNLSTDEIKVKEFLIFIFRCSRARERERKKMKCKKEKNFKITQRNLKTRISHLIICYTVNSIFFLCFSLPTWSFKFEWKNRRDRKSN